MGLLCVLDLLCSVESKTRRVVNRLIKEALIKTAIKQLYQRWLPTRSIGTCSVEGETTGMSETSIGELSRNTKNAFANEVLNVNLHNRDRVHKICQTEACPAKD